MYTFKQLLNLLDDDFAKNNSDVQFAIAAELIGFSRISEKPFPYVLHLLNSAIKRGFIELYFDRFANCVCVVLWAMLSEERLLRLIKEPEFRLTDGDFDSGDNLYILDCIILTNDSKFILLDLKNRVFKNSNNIVYARIKLNRRIFKKIKKNKS